MANQHTHQLIRFSRLAFLLAAFSTIFGLQVMAQYDTWTYTDFDPNLGTQIANTISLDNGQTIATGVEYTLPFTNFDVRVYKLDGFGNEVWSLKIPTSSSFFSTRGVQVDSNHVIIGYSSDGLYKIRLDGTIVWHDSLPPGPGTNPNITQMAWDEDQGEIAMTIQQNVGSEVWMRLVVMDTSRNRFLDSTYYLNPGAFHPSSLKKVQDGNYVIAGKQFAASTINLLAKIDTLGNLAWLEEIDTIYALEGPSILEDSNGNLFLISPGGLPSDTTQSTYLSKRNPMGEEIWFRKISANLYGQESAWLSDTTIVFSGVDTSLSERLIAIDTTGNILWNRPVAPNYPDRFASYSMRMNKKGILLSGFLDKAAQDGHVIQLDSLGRFIRNRVFGSVYYDSLANCIQDSGELGIPFGIVRADPSLNYSAIQSDGTYEMMLDSGDHWLSIPNILGLWSQTCPSNPDSLFFSFSSITDTIQNADFGLEPISSCPYLVVDAGVPFLRPCSSSTYTLLVRNMGTAVANFASVDIELDTNLTLVSTSPQSFISTGPNTFSIQLGNIPPFGTVTTYIEVLVDCNLDIIGRTPCMEVVAFPNEPCFPAAMNWDSSSVQVTGICLPGDTVEFVVENIGTGNMVAPTGIIIAEDDILRQSFMVQLTSGSDTTIKIPGNGSTWTLLADQVNNHPGISYPRATVEACGLDTNGLFSTGHINSLPQDDQNPYNKILCEEITASYDPNDKRGIPLGTFDRHLINATDVLDYRIRFQNTGSDTAFKVVIIDKLPAELDLETIEFGAASHPYTLDIHNNHTLQWTFDGILLPDSNTNEPQSHGYVNFRIHQTPNNQPGTRIENAAAIYFDFNDPIITDTSFHTIADPEIGVVLIQPENALDASRFMAYPNPFKDAVQFVLPGNKVAGLQVDLFDLQGRNVGQAAVDGQGKAVLYRNNLPKGLYIYRISTHNRVYQTGKLIAE